MFQLEKIPENMRAKEIIEDVKIKGCEVLDLNNEALSKLPEELFTCVQLTKLNLGNNDLKGLLCTSL